MRAHTRVCMYGGGGGGGGGRGGGVCVWRGRKGVGGVCVHARAGHVTSTDQNPSSLIHHHKLRCNSRSTGKT